MSKTTATLVIQKLVMICYTLQNLPYNTIRRRHETLWSWNACHCRCLVMCHECYWSLSSVLDACTSSLGLGLYKRRCQHWKRNENSGRVSAKGRLCLTVSKTRIMFNNRPISSWHQRSVYEVTAYQVRQWTVDEQRIFLQNFVDIYPLLATCKLCQFILVVQYFAYCIYTHL